MPDLESLRRLLRTSSDENNPPAEAIRALLVERCRIAVVGISRDSRKPARQVPSYLSYRGYEIIPVNPLARRILGKTAYPTLGSVPGTIDLVLIFRPSEDAGEVMREAEALMQDPPPAVWLQEGIRDDAAAAAARGKGLVVVQDLCIFKAHRALQENLPSASPLN